MIDWILFVLIYRFALAGFVDFFLYSLISATNITQIFLRAIVLFIHNLVNDNKEVSNKESKAFCSCQML